MKKNYKHIISTRFNVPTNNWTTTREGHKALSEEWLRHRFEIFGKYTFPSFKSQSNDNFLWMVFFDVNTPKKYLEKIEDFQKEFKNFIPYFVSCFDEMNNVLITKCNEITEEENLDFIISADIDNDDIIHKDFIKTVQELYRPQHDLVIDLRYGLQLTDVGNNNAFLNEIYTVANPFVSIVEHKKQIGTVIKEKHLAYRNYKNYTFYDKKPMFIQYIHENNLVNTTLKTKKILSLNFSNFGIAPENEFKIQKIKSLLSNLKRGFKLLLKK